MHPDRLRDLIYLDIHKVASLWSQLEGGLLKETEQTKSDDKTKSSTIRGGLALVNASHSETDESTSITIARRAAHHDLLAQLEAWLQDRGLVTDCTPHNLDDESLRAQIEQSPYISITGHASFEDYSKIISIGSVYRELAWMVFREEKPASNAQATKIGQINKAIIALSNEFLANDGNPEEQNKIRKKILDRIRELDLHMGRDDIDNVSAILYGVAPFLRTFAPTRFHVRISRKSGQIGSVIGNLKRDCFLDGDPELALEAYALESTVPMTLFGVCTYISPQKTTTDAQPEIENATEQANIGTALVQVLSSYRQLAEHMNPIRFPSLGVMPIAIYRDVRVPSQ